MKIVLVILLCIFVSDINAQISDIESDLIVERAIEFLGEQNESNDVDFTSLIEDFYHYLNHPINLNQANEDDLKALQLLTDIQISSIVTYRKKTGKLLSIYELGAIEELDVLITQMILPFVQVGPSLKDKVDWRKAFKYGKNDLILRYQRILEEKEGYKKLSDSILLLNPNKNYLGNADKYYLRYRYTYKNNLSIGITAEKDPGETFLKKGNDKGFDYYSAHIMFKELGPISTLVVGDFHANFGQGLNIWTGFNMGKSAQVLNVKQFGRGLRPYTSANESNFFRGIGLSFGNNKIKTSLFGSFKKVDANFTDLDSLSDDHFINSFQITGYHRTPKELENKNRVKQLVFGGATSFQTSNFKINLTSIYTKYSNSLSPNKAVYNQFDFSGNEQLSFGLDYQFLKHNLSFFGETTTTLNGKPSTINGLAWHVDPKLDLVVLHRFLNKANNNLYNTNFSRATQNENGIYLGVETKISSKIKWSTYYDQAQSNWFKYLIDGPSSSRTIFTQMDFKLNNYASLYLRYRNQLKERNITGNSNDITKQGQITVNSFRIHYSHKLTYNISVKTRIEVSKYVFNKDQSKGFMMYQDLIYKFKKTPLKLYARYAMFDTDDYNSRIYTYENDLLYVFSIPSLYNQGFRTYLMAKYEIGKYIDLWLRWSRISFVNETQISSGLEQINSNHKSELKFQFKVRF